MSHAAGPWPAGGLAGRGRRGPGVKPFTADSSGPFGRDPLATVTITANNNHPPEGPDGSGRAAGLTLGGRLCTMRASLSRTQPRLRPRPGPRVARQPPGALAERERALAGVSGGASGPCRPGLKTYRKFSGAGRSRFGTAVLRGVNDGCGRADRTGLSAAHHWLGSVSKG